jgi:hypothetical protein
MKALNFFTHPIILIVSFLIIMISGEHFGGFYALYILLALPHGGPHSVLALLGIMLLILSNATNNKRGLTRNLLNVFGAILLVLSVIVFFYTDKEGYNYRTFYQTIPVITLLLFCFLTLLFLIKNLIQTFNKKSVGT